MDISGMSETASSWRDSHRELLARPSNKRDGTDGVSQGVWPYQRKVI